MIRNISDHNETIKPNGFELDRLRIALPEYFDSDGNFMIDRLQQALQDGDVDLTREGYELKFLGKSYAKYITSTKTETVVVPDLEHNSKPENKESENLYIVGDNLDALKHLLGSYAGQVKCIYIDPPYNTGSDGFVYNDDFGFTIPQLVEKVGLTEDEAERVLDLRGKSSHSAWLTFMYPRLQLAKELLADDGVIFISIDDNELNNLKLICDEVFGEQGFVASITVKNNPRGRQSNTSIAPVHDYLLVYSISAAAAGIGGRGLTEKDRADYKYEDNRGKYRLLGLRQRGVESLREDRPDMYFPIYVNPENETVSLDPVADCAEVLPRKSDGRDGRWMWGINRCREEIDQLVPTFVKRRGEYDIAVKDYLKKDGLAERTKKAFTIWDSTEFNQQVGTQEVKELLSSESASYPKPTPLLKEVLQLGTPQGGLIVDFFSGSGTTAEASFRLSAETGLDRQFIMVQLPEVIDGESGSKTAKAAYKAGYRTIDEIGRERIKRAAAKVKKETGADIDYGFKLYRLNEPSGQVLDDLLTFDTKQDGTLLAGDYVSKFDLNGTPGHDTVLATWLVEDGHGLVTGAQQVTLDGYELDVCRDSAYIISPGLTSDDVVELVRQLENGDLAVSRVVVFGYSVTFGVMHELKKNLSVLKSGRTVSVIERL
ncbi:site-specific DNA-methyltransferase [Brevibacterium ravenspurgense]|uniref:site-specific DNA-methyltransferase n=1 Tax=Brevibacterium ravenspurgense TaxID=479117 RepID=UPI0002F00F4D|nr:site-specific DNA-methyltransferase [Brevibacterium ravenspurgense]